MALCARIAPNVLNIDTRLLASSKHLTTLYIQTRILKCNYCKPRHLNMFTITLNRKLFRLGGIKFGTHHWF